MQLSRFDMQSIPELAVKTMARPFRSLSLLCHPDKGRSGVSFEVLLEAKNKLGDEEAKQVFNKRGLEAVKDFLSSQMMFETHKVVYVEKTNITEGANLG